MKRLFCVFICVVIVFAMAVPVFAAATADNAFGAKATAALEAVTPLVKDGYRYYLCFYSSSTGYSVGFIFSPQKEITSSTPLQVVYYSSGEGVRGNVDFVGFSLEVNGSALRVLDGNGNRVYYAPGFSVSCNYYASDFSTAQSSVIDNFTFTGSQLRTIGVTGVPLFPVDTTELEAVLAEAKAVDQSKYAVSTLSALQEAVQVAETLLLDEDKTESQVTAAKTALQSAIDGLRLLPDVTALRNAIIVAKGIVNEYTETTWSAFQSAIREADDLLAFCDYTENQINAALFKLQEKQNGLKRETTDSNVVVSGSALGRVSETLLITLAIVMPICIALFALILGIRLIPVIIRKIIR